MYTSSPLKHWIFAAQQPSSKRRAPSDLGDSWEQEMRVLSALEWGQPGVRSSLENCWVLLYWVWVGNMYVVALKVTLSSYYEKHLYANIFTCRIGLWFLSRCLFCSPKLGLVLCIKINWRKTRLNILLYLVRTELPSSGLCIVLMIACSGLAEEACTNWEQL